MVFSGLFGSPGIFASQNGDCSGPGKSPTLAIRACTGIINNPHAAKGEKASALAWRAELFASLHDYDRAIRDYRDAAKLEPTRYDLNTALGSISQRAGDYDAAIDFYSAVSVAGYANVRALEGIAEAQLANGNALLAALTWSKIIEKEPQNEAARLGRAASFGTAGRDEEALADFDAVAAQAQKTCPDGAACVRYHLARGTYYFGRGGDAKAALHFEAITKSRADVWPAAVFMYYSGQPKQAFDLLVDWVEKHPPGWGRTQLWLDLLSAERGHPSRLRAWAAAHPEQLLVWPDQVAFVRLGQQDASNLPRRGEHACETFFYLGKYARLDGNKAAAIAHFQQATRTCRPDDILRYGAIRELVESGALSREEAFTASPRNLTR